MGNLGTMEPEKILLLLAGSVALAFVILLFTVAYIVIARRGKRTRKGSGTGAGGYGQGTLPTRDRTPTSSTAQAAMRSRPSDLLAHDQLSRDQISPGVDVSARLEGTGREAWLEDGSSQPVQTLAADEDALYHGQEVLRLLRDPHTGRFWVQVAGMRYRSLSDIRDRAVGERVLAAISHLLAFSDGVAATDQGVMSLELPRCDRVKVPSAFGILSAAREPGEMIRLMSNPEQEHICVHVTDQCYRRLVDVSQRETGRLILEAITRLLQFSNGLLATNDGVGVLPVPPLSVDVHTSLPSAALPDSQDSDLAGFHARSMSGLDSLPAQTGGAPTSGSAAHISEQERFLQQLMSRQAAPSESQTPIERPSLVGSIRRMRKGTSSEILPSLNLAEEIDQIFQSMLVASGLGATDAGVETRPDGGVRIRVGTLYYDSPDEVPDSQLRDMLKLSIAEWERS